MVQLWMGWCRLCAREDPSNTHINVLKNEEGLPLTGTIGQCFAIDINSFSNLPIVICTECYCHIRTAIGLNERIAKVSAMFAELQITSNYDQELDSYTIKARHNLECDFKVFTTNNCSCSKKTNSFESRDKLSQIDEQMIDQELVNCNKVVDLNPIKIKVEQDEVDHNYGDHLDTHSEEICSNTSATAPVPVSNKKTAALIKHENKAKRKNRKIIEIQADNLKKPHYCSECEKGFLKFHNYRRHMQSAHGITIDRKPQLVICENCGKEYRSISALREHEHSHTEERTLKCKYCEKTFKGIPSLRIHEDTHNETNYICVICGLKLKTQRTLRMHMLVHSDQRKHKCDHCGSEFKRAKALKNHLIQHTGLKPYSCEFCNRTFTSGANCRSHKKKSHPIELAQQEAAGRKNITKIPKLSELKAATVSKVKVGKSKDRSQDEKHGSSSLTLQSTADRPREGEKSLGYEKPSPKEDSDFFHGFFGKKYVY